MRKKYIQPQIERGVMCKKDISSQIEGIVMWKGTSRIEEMWGQRDMRKFIVSERIFFISCKSWVRDLSFVGWHIIRVFLKFVQKRKL